jgi:hypothetical protein
MSGNYQINHGPVVFERHDDEIIAIQLDSGAYYSMDGVAAQLWSMLDAGMAVDRLVSYFATSHEGDPAAIASTVKDFLERLSSEQLIVPAGDASGTPPVPSVDKSPFPVFDLKVYTDMQDLLLLDPVHDVGDSGWPMASR